MPDDSARDNALPAKRHLDLLRLLQERGQLTVHDLSAFFEVSGDTIRRDLDLLASGGLLKRTHGGAVALDNLVHGDTPFMQRMSTHVSEKKRIAQAACKLVDDGETLLLNGGSSTRFFASELGELRNLTIVTNSLAVPATLPSSCYSDLYLLGGQYNRYAQVTIGPIGFVSASSITVDTAVIGVGGISIREGLTTTVLEEAAMILSMIKTARRTIVLADHSKFGRGVFAHIAPFQQIDVIVTDQGPPPELAQALTDAGVGIIVAP